MDSQVWRRLKDDFLKAIELDEADLVELLRAYDPELRPKLEEMLRGHGIESSFLDRPLVTPEPEEPPPPPERIGPYRLERLLGRGGMGEVFLGRRDDGDFQQRVAIKMLRGWFHAEVSTRRFRVERQILARLEHPNIARLLDGGSTDDGRMYLIMEYVDGVPLDQYCDLHRLSVEQRLRLFEKVCSAVALAHRSLVVHRDLKPANILVTEDGEPKLLDFGIAKLLGEGAVGGMDEAPGKTATWQQPMTPEYASPEQAAGRPITTGTDIYALGVLLYRLLTGASPYPQSGGEPAQVLQAVRRGEIIRPSTRVVAEGGDSEIRRARDRRAEPKLLARRLRGDLDVLIATALHRDPERRYPSVERLAEDVRRHLDGLPISARPDTLTYRLSKFLRRQPLIAAAGVLVLFFAAGVTVLAVQLAQQRDRLAQQRDRLQREQAKSTEVVEFAVGLFAVADPDESRGRTVTALDLLERGAEEVRAELTGQGDLQATMLDLLGEMHLNLGLFDDARPLLTDALELAEQHFGPDSEQVAQTLDNLAAVYRQQGELTVAETLYRRALDIRRRLHGDSDFRLAESLNNLGVLRWLRQDLEGARELIAEALEVTRAARGPDDPEVTNALNNLAALYQASGDPADLDPAVTMLEQAIEINRRAAGEDAPDLGIQLQNLGQLRRLQGDLPLAESTIRQALSILEPALGDAHPQTRSARAGLAGVLRVDARLEAAARQLERAVAAAELKEGQAVHPREVTMRNSWVQILIEAGRLESAATVLAEAERLKPRFRAEYIAVALEHNRARLDAAEGRLEDAVGRLEELRGGVDSERRRVSLGLDLASILLRLDRLRDASDVLDEVDALQKKLLPPGHPDRVRPLLLRAEVERRAGRAADEPLARARRLASRAGGKGSCLEAAAAAWPAPPSLPGCGPLAAPWLQEN